MWLVGAAVSRSVYIIIIIKLQNGRIARQRKQY